MASSSSGTSFRSLFADRPPVVILSPAHYCRAETTMKQRRPPPGLPISDSASSAGDAAEAVADDSDQVPFLGTPYASNQPFDYPFPVNSVPPDPLLGPQKPSSALPIACSIASAASLVQPSPDSFASLPSVVSSLASSPDHNRRSEIAFTDRPVLRHSRSNSSRVSRRSLQSHLSHGSGSSSPSTHTSLSISPPKPSSLSSSPNGFHRRMTLAIAPSREARSAGGTPRRPKSLTLSTHQASNQFANSFSSRSSQSNGTGTLSSLSITSIADDKHIPPTLRSKLQHNGSLTVASYDALPNSAKASARATPTLRPPPPLKRPLPARAYSHASSFVRAVPVPVPIQEPELELEREPTTTPSPTESSMKRVIKKTASLVELGLEGLKRAASGRSSASSRRSRTRAGSRA